MQALLDENAGWVHGKPYCQKYTDFVKVDVHVAGVLKEHAYKVELSMDGLSMIWRRAIPDYFFESKQMMDKLKGAYHPNKWRVVAHDNRYGASVGGTKMP